MPNLDVLGPVPLLLPGLFNWEQPVLISMPRSTSQSSPAPLMPPFVKLLSSWIHFPSDQLHNKGLLPQSKPSCSCLRSQVLFSPGLCAQVLLCLSGPQEPPPPVLSPAGKRRWPWGCRTLGNADAPRPRDMRQECLNHIRAHWLISSWVQNLCKRMVFVLWLLFRNVRRH